MDPTSSNEDITTSRARTLPIELVELIFSHVDVNDHATCSNVSLTNKLARRAVVPSWYRVAGIQGEGLSFKQRQQRLHLLVRTLIETPTLAQHVCEIRQDLYTGMGRPLRDAANDDFPYVKYIAKMRELGIQQTYIAEFLQHLLWTRHISNAWHFFMLMILCPNATELTFTGTGGQMKSYSLFPDLLKAAVRSNVPCGLQKVEKVQLLHTSEGPAPTVEDVLLLMIIPKLETVVVNNLSSLWPTGYLAMSLRTQVTTLEIRNFNADPDNLSTLITVCPNLQHLVLQDPQVAHYNLYLRDLSNVLANCHALKSLSLTVDFEEYNSRGLSRAWNSTEPRDAERSQDEPVFMDLSHLPQVTDLRLSYCLLCGPNEDMREVAKRLPSTLRKLQLIAACPPSVECRETLEKALKGVSITHNPR